MQHVGTVKIGKAGFVDKSVRLGIVPTNVRLTLPSELVIGERYNIRSGTMIYAGSIIGDDFSTGHNALIREYVILGSRVSIGSYSEVEQDTTIGNGVRIHSHCFLAEGTVIEENAVIAPGVFTASDMQPLLPKDKKKRKGPTIRRNCYIGMRAVILPGVEIGEGSFVAAGSLVTKDVPPRSFIKGSPARVVSSIEDYLHSIQ